ncbi:MAG: hypothetical protein HC818_07005 [Synechococcaceae cyanobacterium RM1_1_27]|nr:hypothetical protein [Synechococcaceae cyanobacterium RM1_1_27]
MTSPPAQDSGIPRLYQEFAEWWHLLSPPDEYEEEATFSGKFLRVSLT